MKKKFISLCLVAVFAATAAVGGTLAYFTDTDKVENTFAIGNVEIDLYEKTDYYDGEIFQEKLDYSQIMPGDNLSKEPYIENTGSEDAYVRVAVVMNNMNAINEAIDEVYEDKKYTDEQIQAIYDKVFDGWGVNYTRRSSDDPNVSTRRMWMTEREKDARVLFSGQVDMYTKNGDYGMYDVNNTFKSNTDTDSEGFDYKNAGYYCSAVENDERVYVFYLKLAGKNDNNVDSYKLFDGLNVPADFTGEQMKMFDGLKINIYADAIQTANFVDENGDEDPKAAFTALQATHPLGWWNNTNN